MKLRGITLETVIPAPLVRAYLDALLPLAATAQEPALSLLVAAQKHLRILEWQHPHFLKATWQEFADVASPDFLDDKWESFDHVSIAIMGALYDAARSVSDEILNAFITAVERDASAIHGRTPPDLSDLAMFSAEALKRTVIGRLRSPTRRPLRAFLSYCREDLDDVTKLYERVSDAGIDVWFDQIALLPGHDWKIEIESAVRRSDVVIVCLSQRAVSKTGYVQKEIREALQYAEEHPPGTVFVIPVRLDDCAIPLTLRHLHCVDLSAESGYEKLLLVLQQRSLQIDSERPTA